MTISPHVASFVASAGEKSRNLGLQRAGDEVVEVGARRATERGERGGRACATPLLAVHENIEVVVKVVMQAAAAAVGAARVWRIKKEDCLWVSGE